MRVRFDTENLNKPSQASYTVDGVGLLRVTCIAQHRLEGHCRELVVSRKEREGKRESENQGEKEIKR